MGINDVINEFDGEIQGEPLNVEIHSWRTEGDWIAGQLKEVNEFKEGNFDNTCKQYILKTDDGLVSCVLGQAVDKQIGAKLKIDNFYYIKFKGQLDLGDGRSVNRFSVIDVTEWIKHKRKHEEVKEKEQVKVRSDKEAQVVAKVVKDSEDAK